MGTTTIAPGGTLIDKATGQVIGKTAGPVQVRLVVDARPAVEAFGRLHRAVATFSLSLQGCGRALRRFMAGTGQIHARKLALRQQAKRKGRPGWRSIVIPRAVPLPAQEHDDRLDAFGPFAHRQGEPFAPAPDHHQQGATAQPTR
jgi:hypothetical protein